MDEIQVCGHCTPNMGFYQQPVQLSSLIAGMWSLAITCVINFQVRNQIDK